ncbi:Bipolar DNA helicase [Planctomycetales bacterium 10988]|nr:Bipolar DNA helicase [Planctomycetales bacterium 10988]
MQDPFAPFNQDSDGPIQAIPADAFHQIDEDCQAAGGEFNLPEEEMGSVGRTMFDSQRSEDGTVTVLLPQESLDDVFNQSLVRIQSRDGRTYLGMVVEGPFAEPDGLRADSPPIVISTVQGGMLLPKYHGRAQVEILGERLENNTIVPPRRRPKPNSPVFPLDAKETAETLGIQGDLRIGLAEGFEELEFCIPAKDKSVLPRHLGILGTTGGGKSTTVSGLVAKAQKEGMGIILIDTEGEYTALHEATDDESMKAACEQLQLSPEGVKNTHLYHLVGRETANPAHPSKTEFSPRFWALSPYMVQEILELNDAQSDRFFDAYSITKRAMEQFKIFPRERNAQDRDRAAAWDELDTGYPMMQLKQLYDVIHQTAAILSKEEGEIPLATLEFAENRSRLVKLIQSSKPGSIASWRALQGKLGKIRRLKIFDAPGVKPLNFAEMLKPGRVSIIDLSDSDSTQINNLVIAELLRGIQAAQDRSYKKAIAEGRQPTPTLIFIEEAHEFLSAARIRKMDTLFQQVARIARRGRKRWLGLAFITQLPQHLPDEVLGLINNWVLHKITDANVIRRLKQSVPGLNESQWNRLQTLAPGQAIVSFTPLTRPLQITVDPTPCRLLMVE